ncbi:DUF2865 domain-containing protein [uncultured Roseibium sp.]|uniref:DUF2865 domain-containing protein n=1 Tax=uncultured Roseibium sp. TaxID=1936171 RepID=UPI00261C35C2|nr:DUF2865 domain-containing protein [uncultured Roseibium sp.]
MRLCRNAKSGSILRTLIVCAAFVLPAHDAIAASCASLKSELRRLESGSGNQSATARKWSAAKQQQQNAISAAERDARYFNCARGNNPNCAGLNSKIKRMKANLAKIDRQLARSGGGSAKNTNRIRQIKASLAKCNRPTNSREANRNTNTGEDKPRNLFSRLFNPQTRAEPVAAHSGDRDIRAVRRKTSTNQRRTHFPTGGTFRTLCVRTCDGYFFPVSFSTGKNQFVNDQARCSEICPAAETELYVYRNPGGDQAQMMSLAGDLYADQPFAHRYKSEYVEGCSCRATGQAKTPSSWTEFSSGSGNRIFLSDISAGLPRRTLQPSRGGTFEEEENAPSPFARTPLRRAHLPRYEDPDTLFNLEKGFDVTVSLGHLSDTKGAAGNELAKATQSKDGLPVLSIRARLGEDDEGDSSSQVFRTHDDGFRPAQDSRKDAVRVVGPEYFVAQ